MFEAYGSGSAAAYRAARALENLQRRARSRASARRSGRHRLGDSTIDRSRGAHRRGPAPLLARINRSRADQFHDGIEETLTLLGSHLRNAGVAVTKEYGDLPSVLVRADEVNQVFLNLLTNALAAVSGREPASIRIRTGVIGVDRGDRDRGQRPRRSKQRCGAGFSSRFSRPSQRDKEPGSASRFPRRSPRGTAARWPWRTDRAAARGSFCALPSPRPALPNAIEPGHHLTFAGREPTSADRAPSFAAAGWPPTLNQAPQALDQGTRSYIRRLRSSLGPPPQ